MGRNFSFQLEQFYFVVFLLRVIVSFFQLLSPQPPPLVVLLCPVSPPGSSSSSSSSSATAAAAAAVAGFATCILLHYTGRKFYRAINREGCMLIYVFDQTPPPSLAPPPSAPSVRAGSRAACQVRGSREGEGGGGAMLGRTKS